MERSSMLRWMFDHVLFFLSLSDGGADDSVREKKASDAVERHLAALNLERERLMEELTAVEQHIARTHNPS